jgi:cysteine desulfurase
MERIYADFASATPTDPRVTAAMLPYFETVFANPSSQHSLGKEAARAVDESKQILARFINSNPENIYFTGSSTESNNLAILGVAKANKDRQGIITSQIEHPSILNVCKALEKDGRKITYLPVDDQGLVDIAELEKAITENTLMVSTHFGNSELGVLQDIEKIGAICHKNNVLFHVDASQATVFEQIDVQKMNIDLLTIGADKMYGPKGISMLYVANGVSIFPIIYGGGQQKSLRSGTENVPGIVGIAKAAEIIIKQSEADKQKVARHRDQLQIELAKINNVKINITTDKRLANHLSIRIEPKNSEDIKGRDLVREMDELGVAVASGSACSATSIVESHVLAAIGLTSLQAQRTLRITLGRETSVEDCKKILSAVKIIAKR